MPRSPFSPFGKRMRTMEGTNDLGEDSGVSTSLFRGPSTSRCFQDQRGHHANIDTGGDERKKKDRAKENADDFNDEDDEDNEYDDDADEDEDEDDEDDDDDLGEDDNSDSDSDSEDGSDDEEADDRDLLTVYSDRVEWSPSGLAFRQFGRVFMRDTDDDEDDDDDDDDEDDDDFIGIDSEDDEDEIELCVADEYLKHDPTPDTPYPKPDWLTLRELRQRKCGLPSSRHTTPANMSWFKSYVNNSLWMIQRLELSKRLEEHTGCVNCLDFNSKGNLLCSGSDDLAICIWDWQLNKLRKKIITGHTNNVLCCQFCNSDSNIITSSRDGQVRLLDIETSFTEALLYQAGEVNNFAFITPQTLVTCGTNASVNFIDLRAPRDTHTTKLFIVRNPSHNRTCALHSIDAHPLDRHKIVVAGASPYVFLYDLRRVARNPTELEHKPTYCLDNFLESTNNIVTSTAFNATGDKLLISYNDDDLFVCRTDTCEIIHRYKGHRNRKTIKGCAWFGDNFVLSGSDDGHIYGWDLESEHIVCFLEGDVKGVVNSLKVHPDLPVLASSGFDHNVKVWEPISKTWPQTLKGIKPQICKNTMRRKRTLERMSHILQIIESGESDTEL